MKILHEGNLNKRMVWFTTCDDCGSDLRIIEGDPHAGVTCYNCDASQYYIRYICPVCGGFKSAWTESSFGIKANSKYEEIVLEQEDRDEIDNWGDCSDLNNDAIKHINNRCRV